MPTVLRIGPYRLFFFSNEGQGEHLEPPHVHVKVDNKQAKFWLTPIDMATNHGFKPHELNEIERIVRQHRPELLEAWYDHLG